MRTRIVKETSNDGKVKYRCERCYSYFFGLFEEWETMAYRIPKELGDGIFYAIYDTEEEAMNFLHPYTKEIVKVYDNARG